MKGWRETMPVSAVWLAAASLVIIQFTGLWIATSFAPSRFGIWLAWAGFTVLGLGAAFYFLSTGGVLA